MALSGIVFVATKDNLIQSVSYSVIYTSPAGEGTDLLVELLTPDADEVVKFVSNLLSKDQKSKQLESDIRMENP